MNKVRILVSSTCYDLAAIREDLREHIIAIGHEPLLSEYPSFPVDPDENAIANCQRNVRNYTDVLVLIIGGRRGALDSSTGMSVTNLEYDTARESGVSCFVFVNQTVHTLFSVWKKNKDADFSPAVDYPEVFRFIERIQTENRWIFTFEKTAEIKEILCVQLSTLFRDLLLKSREGKLAPLANFTYESAKAQALAREKPKYWEFLLTGELLSQKLKCVRRRFERIRVGLIHIPARPVKASEFLELMQCKAKDLNPLVNALKKQIEEIQASWVPGDAHAILRSVNELIDLCNSLIQWEEDLISLSPPQALQTLKETMRGLTEGVLAGLERFPLELLTSFEGGAKISGPLTIKLTLDTTPTNAFHEEVERIVQNPEQFFR